MKKIVTEERFEVYGTPLFWVWLLIGAMWLLQLVLHIADGEGGLLVWTKSICTVCSFLSAWIWSQYHLIADEKGIELRQGGKPRSIAWQEIEWVEVHNRVSLSKATGLTLHFTDPDAKPLYLNQEGLLPVVKRYTDVPVKEA